MKIVIDIEANGLVKPDKIWCIVCKDIDTGEYHVFREPTTDARESSRFYVFAGQVSHWIGHNILGYDWPILSDLLGLPIPDVGRITDTFIASKIIDYPRVGHSIEDYGLEFGIEKSSFSDFTQYSLELEARCKVDVDITHRIYLKYKKYIDNPIHKASLDLEHSFQIVCNNLQDNGFSFNVVKAKELLYKVEEELKVLDTEIKEAFLPRLKLIREVIPKETRYGTISLSSIPKVLRESIADFTVGAPFCHCNWVDFNPSSHKQIVSLLNEASWKPIDKTETHKDIEREYGKLKYHRHTPELDIRLKELYNKLMLLKEFGWKVNENNLETLPPSAPASARLLSKRIVLESRRRTLTEWLDLVNPVDLRIHGKFLGVGAWTHRMAHQNPNTANIPNEYGAELDRDKKPKKKLYGKELRALWQAPKNRLLVGCDAEGIQLRIFAHYIDDPEFTEALVKGKKEDKSDPHSLNQSILGDVCKSRAAAKRYIFALLLGAGQGKLREILDCSEGAASEAYDRLLSRYTGLAHLKETIIPRDAERGWFTGLDGRRVRIPRDTVGARKHLAMSGYLQNGEAIIMKKATLKWWPLLPDLDCKLVNLVHDEWQTEVPNNMEIALRVASLQADSLRIVGEELGLKCPLAGSYWNDDLKDYTIDKNWSKTH